MNIRVTLFLVLLLSGICNAQTFTNPSVENWGSPVTCGVNTPPDNWSEYSNGGIGADEANFPVCPTTIPPNASDGNVYARMYAATGATGEGMFQNVSGFVPGTDYNIIYDYGGSNRYPGLADVQWHFFIDDIDVDQTVVFHATDAFWTAHTIPFKATSATHKMGVRLYTVTPGSGSGGIDNFRINAVTAPPPVSSFLASDSVICTNACISFTDHSINATAWQWLFPGATPASGTDQNPQNICYLTAGTYSVTLIASNSGGSDTLMIGNYIDVNPSPVTPTITQASDTLNCSTDTSYTSYQWYDDTTLVPNETNASYIATHSGNYNVRVTNKSGCSIAVGINVDLTGLINFLSPGMVVFPNPAKDNIYIMGYAAQGDIRLAVYNVLGEKKEEKIFSSDNEESISISIGNLNAGIYFVRLTNGDSVWMNRFMKE